MDKVAADLKAKGASVTPGMVRAEMDKLIAVAKDQLMKQS